MLCELVWVFEFAYSYGSYGKSSICRILERLLIIAEFDIEAPLNESQAGNAHFGDCLIQQLNRNRGADYTTNFDRKAADCAMS